ncbi:hypothetical protein I601_0909 [Nocardioides dokdonensis FR1436]|uniref:Uncharacterized protein n=1 Tax=Nocardioides dokdonensis FR1436 TaxID=1300347 RepID=A0A1A9GI72_9ACTN|nr:zf-HC2 domain-containing protein [Nocardioides dokdonensis]ANH37352.1 hypothetical protein I601_0909 [Nocardioides dokdonensis FR1436]
MRGPVSMSRSMIECWWSGRVLDRYLEEQPAVPLASDERERLQRHLAVCDRCATSATERRRVHSALDRLGERRSPPPASLQKARELVQDLTDGDPS